MIGHISVEPESFEGGAEQNSHISRFGRSLGMYTLNLRLESICGACGRNRDPAWHGGESGRLTVS